MAGRIYFVKSCHEVGPQTQTTRSRFSCTMPLSSRINRKLCIAEESSDGEEYYEVTDRSSSESVIETGAGGDIVSSDNDQDVLSNSQSRSADLNRKQGCDDSSKSQAEKLEALRRRLRQIKAQRVADGSTKRRNATQHNKPDEDEEKKSDAESRTALKARTGKHASTASRKRHRISEVVEPRSSIKKTKNMHEREKSKKLLASIESQQEARVAKHKQDAGFSEPKKKAKTLITEGKPPILPKSEQKKPALIGRLETMKSKHRKKVTTKERKNMPERRGV
jgi:ribosomal RNA-processing protein 36